MTFSSYTLSDGFLYGLLVSVMLFGCTLLQGWCYFRKNSDGWKLRILVSFIFVLSVTLACLGIAILRTLMILSTKTADDARSTLLEVNRLIGIGFTLSGLLACSVHVFFTRGIFLFTERRPIPLLIMFLTALMFGAITCSFVQGLIISGSARCDTKFQRICVSAFHGLAILTDGIITITFCSMFRGSKVVSVSTGTIDVVKRLFLYSITRGALLGVIQIGHLIMYLNQPTEKFFAVPLYLILDQLYAITTLIMLNGRPHLRDRMEDDHIGSLVFVQEPATLNTSHQESETA
ncbi:hypothetical protein BDQ12DRAFT_672293 [Crucibulum laeve]|uniref:DUF6534 domain-containing protein n=1 Tax=Crucibulum laeve TaxID=68775 RepID=A0A5C3MHB5_9AGAR|nr:hypothetical protein BDQ12DRAFT_672293 [Crucibulum laeve]